MGQTISAERLNHGLYESYKYEYKWTIPNFKSYDVGYHTATTDLYLMVEGVRYTFKLILFPHGYNDRVKNYLSLYLKRGSPVATWLPEEMLIQFTCAILDNKCIKHEEKYLKRRMSIETELGWVSYCKRDFLFYNEEKFLKNGNLTLICYIEIFENKAIMNADPYMYESLSKMSTDMEKLFLEGNFSDFTLKAEGQAFHVHKAILSARSDVFKKWMNFSLHLNLREGNISDIKAETLKKMLFYIYSGSIGSIDVQEAQELYYAADKYQIQELKKICSEILCQNLDLNNVIDLLLLGDRHSDNDLKSDSIKFIAKNASNIQGKQEWISLMQNFPELANMVFKKSF